MAGRPPRTMPGAVLVLLLALTGLVAGCTGVPSSSSPQIVERLKPGARPTEQAIRPDPGSDARTIVTQFLQANAIDPGKHTSAQAFLTTAARSRWSDTSATIIAGQPKVTPYDPKKGTVLVSGPLFGTLDREGVFHPATTSQRLTFVFRIAQEKGEFRIAQMSPAPGLLITSDDFARNYERHLLYFFDNRDRYLVQDPRWTDIPPSLPLGKWLLDRLVDGPRAGLQPAVSSDTFPTQVDPAGTTVTSSPTALRVEIPGSSALDGEGRLRLAAQLSQTLEDVATGSGITITDGGRAVPITSLGSSVFTAADLARFVGPDPAPPELYYLSATHQLLTSAGKPVAGPLGRGAYRLSAVALTRSEPNGPLLVAAIDANAPSRLFVGTESGALRTVFLPAGPVTRPSFASGQRGELWFGIRSRLYRLIVSPTGTPGRPVPVALSQPLPGTIRAVRISPDGDRVAMVIGGGVSGGQLYVGAIVRGSGTVQVGPLDVVNPPQTTVLDVAWLNSLRLFAIGGQTTSPSDSFTFDTGVDGTEWQSHPVNLTRPDSVTVTTGGIVWISAGQFVWEQNGADWEAPIGGQTPGTAPIYVE